MKSIFPKAVIIAAMVFAPLFAATQTITFFEGFDDDFLLGNDVPDLVDASLSTTFSDINDFGFGQLTIRDRGAGGGGNGGGFPPIMDAFVDFSFGGGQFITLKFDAGAGNIVGPGSTISFDIVAYGDDPGTLSKFVSSDGLIFTPVGDNSANNGGYSFNLASGGPAAWFRLQIGNASIFDGCWVDHFSATLNVQPDDDCDGIGNDDDLCPGGDDSVDNNHDGLPDCAFPPAFEDIISAWKCGTNKVSVCHNGHTICINKNALAAHIAHGDFLGPCGNTSCGEERSAVEFSAAADLPGGRVKLEWLGLPTVSGEITRFEIEKSADGRVFELLLNADFDESAGGYYFIRHDLNPFEGSNFYRLKTIWTDGVARFSPVREVVFEKTNDFAVFPNPANEAAWIYFDRPKTEVVRVEIFNSLSIKMMERELPIQVGQPSKLDLASLPNGLYLMTVITPEGRLTTRRLVVESGF